MVRNANCRTVKQFQSWCTIVRLASLGISKRLASSCKNINTVDPDFWSWSRLLVLEGVGLPCFIFNFDSPVTLDGYCFPLISYGSTSVDSVILHAKFLTQEALIEDRLLCRSKHVERRGSVSEVTQHEDYRGWLMPGHLNTYPSIFYLLFDLFRWQGRENYTGYATHGQCQRCRPWET